MRTDLVAVGRINRSADDSFLEIHLDSKLLKEVNVENLTAVPAEGLQQGLRILLRQEVPHFFIFGKSVEKIRKGRGRAKPDSKS
ncbi:MAG: hypothetical protein KC964_18385 [Candidatus Omnitrophica bacterium]|nr:hypothetical protein [Candidatus Omnitrophota bacterium]